MNAIKSKALMYGLLFAVPCAATQLPSSGEVTTDDCMLLGEPVHIALSKGTKAVYVCNGLTGVIGFAACHIHGRRNATLTDGSQTSTGVVYTMRSDRDGGGLLDVAGCPRGDEPIPDDVVSTGDQG
jgi:hypothetical protein